MILNTSKGIDVGAWVNPKYWAKCRFGASIICLTVGSNGERDRTWGMKKLHKEFQYPYAIFQKNSLSLFLVNSVYFIYSFSFSVLQTTTEVCSFLCFFTNSFFYFHITRWVGSVTISKPIVFYIIKDRMNT